MLFKLSLLLVVIFNQICMVDFSRAYFSKFREMMGRIPLGRGREGKEASEE